VTWVDSNILIDLALANPGWAEWSRARLVEAAAHGGLAINDIIYAEVSVCFSGPGQLDDFLAAAGIAVERTPSAALFLAARTHLAYRRRGGVRTGVLADFFIGADAAVRRLPLLTRDPQRYRSYFPDLHLIAP
jgi:predicted nucleic acid-binding protein